MINKNDETSQINFLFTTQQNRVQWLQKTTARQIIAILPVNMAYLSAGIGCGWLAPIFQRYKNSNSDFSLNTEACSWIACIHYVGRGIGCILTAALVNHVGRNKAFVFSAVSALIIWVGVFSSKSIPAHLFLRVIFGIGVGTFEMAAPLYIGENSSPYFRGIFSSMCTIAFYIGELLEFIVATYLSYFGIAIVNIIITIAIIASTFLLREPAAYLLSTRQIEKAEKCFYELRGNDEAAKREFEDTKQHLAEKEKVKFSYKLMTNKGVRSVVLVNGLVYMSGYPAINSMSSLIFMSVMNLAPNELTILLGVIQLLGVFISSTIIEKIGRRFLLMISSAISFISHLIVAILFMYKERGTPLPFSNWLLFVSVAIYSIIIAAIFFPISTTIRGELLSPQLKPIGGCLAIILNSVIAVGITGIFLSIAETYGMKMNFLFFAGMSALLLIYVYFDLLETKGLTLIEIQKSLRKSNRY